MGQPIGIPLALRLLPKRLLSRLVGGLTAWHAPGFLLRPAIARYARAFGADPLEAAEPFEAHTSFRSFFTRALRPDARPLASDPRALVSPCDGAVVLGSSVEEGTILQAKGAPYSLSELLGDGRRAATAAAARFVGGTALIVYLAPGDYHRFHWPWDGRVSEARHLPGDLWPVNARAVAGVPRLFARNERVVLLGELASGRAFAFVPVGALNVGSIRVHALADLVTNRAFRRASPSRTGLALPAERGQELGWFELGSSIVLLLGPGAGGFANLAPAAPLRVGLEIGRLA